MTFEKDYRFLEQVINTDQSEWEAIYGMEKFLQGSVHEPILLNRVVVANLTIFFRKMLPQYLFLYYEIGVTLWVSDFLEPSSDKSVCFINLFNGTQTKNT